MTEGELQRCILAAIPQARNARLFRNTVGRGWMGDLVSRSGDRIVLAHARPVTFGLIAGSPDLVGWRTVTVTPEMVGQSIAQFAGIEIKTAAGRVAPNQRNFLTHLAAAGGLAEVVRDPQRAVEVLRA